MNHEFKHGSLLARTNEEHKQKHMLNVLGLKENMHGIVSLPLNM